MNKRRKARLQRVSLNIAVAPLCRELVDAAFERFCETGDLPEELRLACVVVERALAAKPAAQVSLSEGIDRLVALVEQMRLGQLEPSPRLLREPLFYEAVHPMEPVREAARIAIKVLIAQGRDVTDPEFVDPSVEPLPIATVGLHLIGWPECLVKPPYEAQTRRAIDRLIEVQQRVDIDDEAWLSRFCSALDDFCTAGQLPHDEVIRDAVLAQGEMLALSQHDRDRGNAQMLQAFEALAAADADGRAAALERVQAVAGSGCLDRD